jgi:hypothetical protein
MRQILVRLSKREMHVYHMLSAGLDLIYSYRWLLILTREADWALTVDTASD